MKNKESPKLICIGYALHDINKYPDSTERCAAGGGGYFSALAASTVLDNVGLVTRVGGDFDLTRLRKRLNCEGIKVCSDQKTPRATITYRDFNDLSNREIAFFPEGSDQLCPSDIPVEWTRRTKGFLVSTMVPLQQQMFIQHLVKMKNTSVATELSFGGVKIPTPFIAIDSDACWLMEEKNKSVVSESMKLADIVFMNRLEGEILSNILNSVPLLVLKKDAEGAELYFYGDLLGRAAAPKVEAVDVTGAGDILAGVMLSRLILGDTPIEAIKRGVESATISVSKFGIHHLFRNV